MKPIELTEEHKKKLLEMCRVLFPELNNLEVRDSMEDFCFPFEHICVEYERNIIHWFEFVIQHLATKIYNLQNPSTTMTLYRGYLCQEVDNPIDYLYEQFKKLNETKETA